MRKKYGIKAGIRALWLKVLVMTAVSMLCVSAFAFTICGSCGYESDDGAKFCSHCGARLDAGSKQKPAPAPAVKKKPAAASKVDGVTEANGRASDKVVIPFKYVAAEMRMAQDYFKRGRPELASLFAGNALALNMLAGEDAEGARYKSIIAFRKKCDRAAERGSRRCPACRGSGKAVMSAQMLENSRVSLNTSGMRCRLCGGTGVVRGDLTIDERKSRIGAASEEYRTLQQSRGMRPEGLAWVPAKVVSSLDVRSRVVLKRAVPEFCSYCMGIGRVDCRQCKGTGVVKCRAKRCHGGYVESDSNISRLGAGSLGKRYKNKEKCPECHGTGVQTCKECKGSGSFVCKHCNGSGYAPICKKCKGKGLVQCRRCAGSGVYRDKACPYCQKEGSIECSSCGGTGRRR